MVALAVTVKQKFANCNARINQHAYQTLDRALDIDLREKWVHRIKCWWFN